MRIDHKIALESWLLLGLALVAAGCSGSPGIQRTTCVSSSECPGGYACVSAACISLSSNSDAATPPGDAGDAVADKTTGTEQNDAVACNTTQVTATYTGTLGTVSASTPLIVGVMNGPEPKLENVFLSHLVTTNGATVTFSLPPGTYYLAVVFDVNGDGAGPGDPVAVLLDDKQQPRQVTPPICASFTFDDTLTIGAGDSPPDPFAVYTGTSRRIDGSGITDQLVVHTHAEFPIGDVLAVELTGPGQTSYAYDMQTCGTVEQNGVSMANCGRDFNLTTTPKVGDQYVFMVTYKDNSVKQFTQTLKKVVVEPPSLTSPPVQAFSPTLLGKELSLVWTLPQGLSQTAGMHINGSVCPNQGNCVLVEGTVTSATTGKITFPGISGAVSARINVSFHDSDVRSGCDLHFE